MKKITEEQDITATRAILKYIFYMNFIFVIVHYTAGISIIIVLIANILLSGTDYLNSKLRQNHGQFF